MVAMVASTVKLTLMTVVYFALHQLSAAVRCNVNRIALIYDVGHLCKHALT